MLKQIKQALTLQALVVSALALFFIFMIFVNVHAQWVLSGGPINNNTNENAYGASIAMDGNTPYVVWTEDLSGAKNVYVKWFDGGVWQPLGGSLNNNSSNTADYTPDIYIDNSTPYVVWGEATANSQNVYVKMWNGSDWQALGSSLNIQSNQDADRPKLVVYNGTPYVTWQEKTPSFMVYAKYYNGSSWELLGSNPVNNLSRESTKPDIALSTSGTPYIAYTEYDSYTFVKYFNGTDWVQVGNEVNNREGSWDPALALYNDTPYIAYTDSDSANYFVEVRFFNGTSWEQIGGILNVNTDDYAKYSYISMLGQYPFVAFTESRGVLTLYEEKVYVKHYDGYRWEQDGGALDEDLNYNAYPYGIEISASGSPYVVFHQKTNTQSQVFVKEYLFPTQTPTATITQTSTVSPTPSITPTSTITPTITQTSTVTPTKTSILVNQASDEILAYPNPGKDRVSLAFSLEKSGQVSVTIYNMNGQLIATIEENYPEAGDKVIGWDSSDIAPGIYLVRIKAEGKEYKLKKVAIVK